MRQFRSKEFSEWEESGYREAGWIDRSPPLEIGCGRTQKSLLSLSSVTGQTVGRAFEGRDFLAAWRGRTGGRRGRMQYSWRVAGAAPERPRRTRKCRVNASARRRRVLVIDGRPKFHLGAARIDHQASCAVIEERRERRGLPRPLFSLLRRCCAPRRGSRRQSASERGEIKV